MKEKTYVEDVDRSVYDLKNEDRDAFRVEQGLTAEIVAQISREKKDPPWMELFRLQSLDDYHRSQFLEGCYCHYILVRL